MGPFERLARLSTQDDYLDLRLACTAALFLKSSLYCSVTFIEFTQL